ncbi:unnamed protein product [Brachionus calyciflorus]|uniref:Enoyl-CoA delta isomerase 1, mitochondrial n=1 Tax=Brachionus calyciflorus TaxID=104777 RepID=A0A813M3H3_9BILA|nr:unnamed protein product [Brachionus calyciflorus]
MARPNLKSLLRLSQFAVNLNLNKTTQLTNLSKSLITQNRNFSTSKIIRQDTSNNNAPATKINFYVEEYKDKGYMVLKFNKAPVNSLNLEFLTELNIQLDKIEQSKDIKGVILTSHLPNIFSAGLDILEMYQIKQERGTQFWTALQETWIKLYGSNKIFIAAINGHSPAGGCLLAMSCDYRIMTKGPYKIGLNETLLGIKAPFWFRDTMINTIGYRETEKALQLGKLYSPEEALAVNLVDEIVDANVLIQKAEEQMVKWCSIPTVARELTKSSMRRDTVSKLIAQRESDTQSFIEFTQRDSIQKSLKGYLEAMKKPKK